jgi:hypothetical protein
MFDKDNCNVCQITRAGLRFVDSRFWYDAARWLGCFCQVAEAESAFGRGNLQSFVRNDGTAAKLLLLM